MAIFYTSLPCLHCPTQADTDLHLELLTQLPFVVQRYINYFVSCINFARVWDDVASIPGYTYSNSLRHWKLSLMTK